MWYYISSNSCSSCMTSSLVHFQLIFFYGWPIPLIFCKHPYCVHFSGMQHGNLRRMHMKIYCKCTSTVILWIVAVTKVVNTAHSQGNLSVLFRHSEIVKWKCLFFKRILTIVKIRNAFALQVFWNSLLQVVWIQRNSSKMFQP